MAPLYRTARLPWLLKIELRSYFPSSLSSSKAPGLTDTNSFIFPIISLLSYFFTKARIHPVAYLSLTFTHTALPLCPFSSCSFAFSFLSIQIPKIGLNTSSLVLSLLSIWLKYFYWTLAMCQALCSIPKAVWLSKKPFPSGYWRKHQPVVGLGSCLRFPPFSSKAYYSQA